MKLNYVEINISTENGDTIKTEIELINSLNADIEAIFINGIDLSTCASEIFSRFDNLKYLNLTNTNLRDMHIIEMLDSKTYLSIQNNPIVDELSVEAIKILKKHKSFMYFRNGIIYDGNISELAIKSVRDISLVMLKDCTDIGTIKLKKDNIDTSASNVDISIYTREDFIKIKQEIDRIINQVSLPSENDPDREKKIFMQVYKILGEKIQYNNYLLSDEGRKDMNSWKTSSNLLDGLTKNTCVCAGYAQILETILDEFGIKSQIVHRYALDEISFAIQAAKYVPGGIGPLTDDKVTIINKILKYDAEMGHAWNTVYLDGKMYLCDLTLDAENIKNRHFPLTFCCCSYEQFMKGGHYRYQSFSYNDDISEISDKKQLEFFGFDKQQIKKIGDMPVEKRGEQLLENGVFSAASNIKNSDFEGIEKSLIIEQEEKSYGKEI